MSKPIVVAVSFPKPAGASLDAQADAAACAFETLADRLRGQMGISAEAVELGLRDCWMAKCPANLRGQRVADLTADCLPD